MIKPIYIVTIINKLTNERNFYTVIYDSIYYKTYDTEEHITYILNGILNNNFDNDDMFDVIINELCYDDNYVSDIILEYFCHVIHYDNNIEKWVLSNKIEPDTNIMNLFNDNITVRVILLGDSFKDTINNDKKRNAITDLIENYYHIKPSIALHNQTDHTTLSELKNTISYLDENSKYVLILSEESGISLISYVTELFKDNDNILVLVKLDNRFYKVSFFIDEIIFKKVDLR